MSSEKPEAGRPRYAGPPAGCELCRIEIKELFAQRGAEITVSTAPPIVASVAGTAFTYCEHGTVFYLEPTSEELMRWRSHGWI